MTTEEINQYIHEEIMCGVNPLDDPDSISPALYIIPDYCSDDRPRRLLDEARMVVVGDGDGSIYQHCLWQQMWDSARQHLYGNQENLRPMELASINEFATSLTLFATAEQIARACVEAHKATSRDK